MPADPRFITRPMRTAAGTDTHQTEDYISQNLLNARPMRAGACTDTYQTEDYISQKLLNTRSRRTGADKHFLG